MLRSEAKDECVCRGGGEMGARKMELLWVCVAAESERRELRHIAEAIKKNVTVIL